jgi:eukaryotic-like serine/threonine-protein kinase
MNATPATLDTATMEQDGQSGVVPRRFAAGEPFGRYRMLQWLGAGTMGSVYEAYDPLLDRLVAIKVPKPGMPSARLQTEARALARIVHPNVVAVHDVGQLNGQTFMVLELVEGVTLRGWLAMARRTTRETVEVVVAAGRGLSAVHAAGLFHRDFKPDNVLVGDDGRVRVLDFGIAGEFGGGEGRGNVVGTPAYMAPEQAMGSSVSPLADQFSFCVVLWEALFGERPYRKQDFVSLARGERNVPIHEASLRRNVPTWLRRLLERGLRVDPRSRHASMKKLLDALEAGLPDLSHD